jgi:two-component system NtrC family sensor kinase
MPALIHDVSGAKADRQVSLMTLDCDSDVICLLHDIFGVSSVKELTTTGGQPPLDTIVSARPDLILTDLRWSISLSLALKADPATAGIPVVVVPGAEPDANRLSEALDAGAEDYIEAGIPRGLLERKLMRAVAAGRQKARASGDTTSRTRPGAILDESEREYRNLFNSIADPVFIFDKETHQFLDFNDAALETYGYSPEELRRMRPHNLHPPEDLQVVEARLSLKKLDQPFSYTHLTKAGKRRYVEVVTNEIVYRDRAAWISIAHDVSRRKRIEDALRASEQRFRLLFERNVAGVYFCTPEGTILDCNESFARMLGFDTREEVVGGDAGQFCFDPSLRAALIASLLEARVSTHRELALRRRDGSSITVFENAMVIDAEPGRSGVIYGTLVDISERKQAEEAVRESERKFSKAFNASPHPMALIRYDDGALIEINESFISTSGYSRDEIIGRPGTELGIWEELNERAKFYKLLAAQSTVRDLEINLRAKNGEVRTLLLSADILELGGQRYVLIASNDITERKRAIDALTLSEEMYRDLFENAYDIIYTHDLDRKFTSFNKAAERITGYTREEGTRLRVDDIVPPEKLEQALTIAQKLLTGESPPPYELELIARDGSRIPIEASTTLIMHKGVPIGFQGIVRDISDRKRLQQQLIRSEKLAALGQLVSGVAHELNNPLTSIIGFTQLMLSRQALDPKSKQHLEIVSHEAERSRRIVRNLLSFARPEMPKREDVDVNQLLTNTLELRSYEMRVNNISLVRQFGEIPRVMADGNQLQQVFLNIIINAEQAILAGRSSGGITVTSRHRHSGQIHWAVISIADDGPGITPDHLDRVFDPFFTTKEVGKGTGLGLSISYGIIEEHGGKIRAANLPSGGAEFTIELPANSD